MGGNVFAGKTAPIKRENIEPTLVRYFAELRELFPLKAYIFNGDHFVPLGSVGKKAVSGDIDLGIDTKDLVNFKYFDESVNQWGLKTSAVNDEFEKLSARARTANRTQLMLKAFLKCLTININKRAPHIYCDESKVTWGNMFSLFPQAGEKAGVQIDWMIGNIEWLKFSYHSIAYPDDSNVKGLHRTQLLLSAFQTANLSFNHVSGVKDKVSGDVVADTPNDALAVLTARLGMSIDQRVASNFYDLLTTLMNDKKVYDETIDTYLQILDHTRCDIPDVLQVEWEERKDRLGLTGKFLPEDSALINSR